ncbi:Bug family tripartite tricarboxylate transporter substrate binding protein [Azohydromonas caseinilytica]|uniref:Tripartite tricarboxylate transporter substrate binding protein n=1 Tax=Azohydromonas caseinilytica TaxID=2728836 RepID=A0A848F9W3_9BURK|nr:tripartite tricarboxylate transporter substrate binding protein [Azohydromonas caseinilytica]NML16048.1 tripartite tricarboxylate transporter substrate binding protein [Azohydromonas caseinilytica]
MTVPFPARRRHLLLVAAAASLLAGTAQAQTAAFPNKPVTIFTAFAPGSGPDAVLRLVSEKLSKTWNQRVLVENRPGGGGFIAIDAVKTKPADGYTLLQLDSEHLAALPHLYKSRGFETLKTFEPAAILFRTPFMLAVAADSKFKTVADVVAAAKAAPGKVSYGSWGVGSPGHLGGEELQMRTGTEMQHVPYREVSQLFTSVGAGDVSWSFGSLPSSQGAFKAGKLRYIAIAAPKRIPQLPDVPTMAEAGGPAMDVNSFVVLVAPRGLPAAVRDKIHADVAKAVAEPDVQGRFNTFAFETLSWSPDEIGRQAAAKSKIYGELAKRKNISLE